MTTDIIQQQRATLSRDLRASQQQMIDVLRTVADVPDWRPDPAAWSFREIAAHMATVEEECFEVRVQRIVKEDAPEFAYYLNTGRDFGGRSLADSLAHWEQVRARLLAYIAGLTVDELARTGQHATFGEINVPGAMAIMLEHDRDHLADLQAQVRQYRSG